MKYWEVHFESSQEVYTYTVEAFDIEDAQDNAWVKMYKTEGLTTDQQLELECVYVRKVNYNPD